MKIAVHGSYFGYNFGDTLLCKIFSDWTSVTEGVSEVVLPLADRKNQQSIGAGSRGLLALLGARGLILCGGGYFSEPPHAPASWAKRAFRRHIMLAKLCKMSGLPIAILGVGVGPVSDSGLRRSIVELVNYASIVVVRDNESKEHLVGWGVERDIQVAADAALSLDRSLLGLESIATPASVKRAAQGGRKTIFLHTTAHPDEREYRIIEAAYKWAADKPELGVILGSDSLTRRRPISWPQRLLSERGGSAEVYMYDGRVTEMCKLLDEVDCILTTKLHVGIVGTVFETPVISVPHHTKTPRFYRQIGLEEQCIPLGESWEELLSQKLDAWLDGQRLDYTMMHATREKGIYLNRIQEFVRLSSVQ